LAIEGGWLILTPQSEVIFFWRGCLANLTQELGKLMCGIAGIFAYNHSAPPINLEELLQIREVMKSRGPDGAGLWISEDKRIALAHRRLSIIDLSEAGAQPMGTSDQSVWVVFNGEIYNYRELRQGLENQGCQFQSHSDTEVLLHLYREYGEGMMEWLRGMYAFAIWDSVRKRLLLGRDPFGIKPLYYADDGKSLRFASQVKALLVGGAVDTSPQPAGHAGFFLWGYVPEPYTLYKGIRSLEAGSILHLELDGFLKVSSHCSIREELAKAENLKANLSLQDNEVRKRLQTALVESVDHHLIADVPVGIFLSSGLDSSTVAALASQNPGQLHSITLGFQELQGSALDETVLAGEIAQYYGLSHQTRCVAREEFESRLSEILEAMDQPSVDGVNTYFVARAAAKAGMKAALSGLGGDELFGGYPSFQDLPWSVAALAWGQRFPGLGRGLRKLSGVFLKRFTSPKYASMLEYGGSYAGAYLLRRSLFMPWELPEVMDPDLAREGWQELQILVRLKETIAGISSEYLKVAALEMVWYMRNQLLRDADWAGMAHSLEIRVPLVDIVLLRKIAPLLASSPRPTKRDMAAVPQKPLPDEVLHRAKSGFYIPVREWLAQTETFKTKRHLRGLRAWAQLVYQYQT
jgi:asparagine synthase (glutamine-hydrolysing)